MIGQTNLVPPVEYSNVVFIVLVRGLVPVRRQNRASDTSCAHSSFFPYILSFLLNPRAAAKQQTSPSSLAVVPSCSSPFTFSGGSVGRPLAAACLFSARESARAS